MGAVVVVVVLDVVVVEVNVVVVDINNTNVAVVAVVVVVEAKQYNKHLTPNRSWLNVCCSRLKRQSTFLPRGFFGVIPSGNRLTASYWWRYLELNLSRVPLRPWNKILTLMLIYETWLSLTTKGSSGSHHRNLSVIYTVQNLFHQGKGNRSKSLNSHYLVLYKNPRDKLATDFAPSKTNASLVHETVRRCGTETIWLSVCWP